MTTPPAGGTTPLVYPVGLAVVGPVSMRTADAGNVTFINLDSTQMVYLAPTNATFVGAPNAIPLSPGDSITLSTTQPWYAVATAPMALLIMPGGATFAPGTVAITGPVTASISGPVTVNGGVAVTNSPFVNIGASNVVAIGNVPTVDINTVAGSINIASVAGNVDVVGQGGFILPGQIATVFNNVAANTIPPATVNTLGPFNVANYASLDFNFSGLTNSSAATGSAMCAVISFKWFDANGITVHVDTISVCQLQNVIGTIPCRGTTVSIQLLNAASVGSLQFPINGIIIDGSFRVVDKVTFGYSSGALPSFAGLTMLGQPNPVFTISDWLISLNLSGLVAANTNVWLLPMYAGPAIGHVGISTAVLSNAGTILDLSYATVGNVTAGTGANTGIVASFSTAIQDNPLNINMPPSQCALVLKASSTSTTVQASLVGVG